MALALGILFAVAGVAYVLQPLFTGRQAPEEARSLEGGNDRKNAVELEIAALRVALREGRLCAECAHSNRLGSRFCGMCGSELPGEKGREASPSRPIPPDDAEPR